MCLCQCDSDGHEDKMPDEVVYGWKRWDDMLGGDMCDVMLFANGWNACAGVCNAVLREGVNEVKG